MAKALITHKYMRALHTSAHLHAFKHVAISAKKSLKPSSIASHPHISPHSKPLISPQAYIHESVYVDENVRIGAYSTIWHFCHILRGSTINEACSIGQGCCIGANVSIGKHCKIQNHVSVYEGVQIEEAVFIGPSVVFTNIVRPRAFINRKHEFRPTILRKGCSIGANATILCGIDIGAYALIGAGSMVCDSVPDFALVVGNPARVIGYVDTHGEHLRFTHNRARSIYDGSEYVLEGGRVRRLTQ